MANSIPEQLSHITNQLTRLSHSLEEVKQRWEQESINTRRQIDSLQAQLRESQALNEAVQTQNKDLEAQLAEKRRVSERQARQTLGIILRQDLSTANERLTHAREYDLISNSDITDNDRVVNENEFQPSLPEDSEDATGDILASVQDASPGPSGRIKSPEKTITATDVGSKSAARDSTHGVGTSTTFSGTLPPDREAEPDTFSVQSTTHRWLIHINKPATTAKVKCGPIRWSQLPSKLGIDEQTVNALRSSLTSDAHLSLNLRMHEKFAFVYDPIFLDDMVTPATYLFDWGKEEDNQSITRYVLERGQQYDSTFHTFVYLLKPNRWYYIGLQEWSHTSLELDIWKDLSQQHLRSRIIHRLHDHCGRVVEQNNVAEALDRRALQQICFHLSGDRHMEASREMCRLMKYDPPAS
ncbi:hypothetical protein GYMLUDRAFT_800111 [Collybiopsis luxurians FD-317 M1]|nr:hypothetical protein GYMLUDRAFT_800111 [Collybiopsis luxurians FD-317 M1]